MIERMRKITVLGAHADRDALLARLWDLGVVHLQSGAEAGDGDLEQERGHLLQLRQAAAALEPFLAKNTVAKNSVGRDTAARDATDAAAVAAQVLQRAGERAELERALAALQQERLQVLPFGDFDPARVAALREGGVAVQLYRYPRGTEVQAPAGSVLHVLGDEAGMTAAALVGPPEASLPVPLRPVPWPPRGVTAVDAEIVRCTAGIEAARRETSALAVHWPLLQAAAAATAERVEVLTARATMGGKGAVAWITGFCPEPDEARLRAAAAQGGMYVLAQEHTPDDVVPTKLSGPGWARQVHAVFQSIGIMPGYGEADVSAPFLLFLLLFAAMLIGDAGYGILLLCTALGLLHAQRRRAGGPHQLVRLLATTSVATIAWGALTGTWFAIASIPAGLDQLRIEWLSGADKVATTRHVMLFCFLLGAAHLTVAHLWAAVRSGRSLQALAQFGWIASTWLMFAIANTMVLGEPFPSVMTTVAIVGVALIVLFMTPLRQLKHEWFNHVMLPLSLVSNFVDVVSYLRLFAVGTAGFAVAASFNEMAARAAAGGGAGWLVAALIAVFGHSLNLLLCAMGVLVHGVRLNTLEFSAHLGLQWSGTAYRPFGRRTAHGDHGGAQHRT